MNLHKKCCILSQSFDFAQNNLDSVHRDTYWRCKALGSGKTTFVQAFAKTLGVTETLQTLPMC